MEKELELLCPAKNLEQGIIAINYGADAVYIGAGKFGARSAVGNNIDEIAELIKYAHLYYAKVYVTINTILYNNELNLAKQLIYDLYNIGADAIIIQDMGLLEFDLPPIPIHASTQTNNFDVDKIQFLENIGLQRVILARELSIKEIQKIKNNTNVELEAFVHGALCVSLSGQCYFSYATTGRSANRGECSQSCRMKYSLEDADGKVFAKDKYLLSMKDLNLSESIPNLAKAGVTSFKIEGRLKDAGYVKNIVSLYRSKIDDFIKDNNEYKRASSGVTKITFTPDSEKTFNRGYTDYYANGRHKENANFDTPKSVGKLIAEVKKVGRQSLLVDNYEKLNNGDGLCYFDEDNKLQGFRVNKAEGNRLMLIDRVTVQPGMKLYRNNDQKFSTDLLKNSDKRKIEISISVKEIENNIQFNLTDENNNSAEIKIENNFESANNPESVVANITKQLSKLGSTIFVTNNIDVEINNPVFIPASKLNEIRRDLIDELLKVREDNYPKQVAKFKKSDIKFTSADVDYMANIVNEKSKDFYNRHGVENIEKGFELQTDFSEKIVMTTKYCLKFEFGLCKTYQKKEEANQSYNEPFYLTDNKIKYLLEFDCDKCFMKIKRP